MARAQVREIACVGTAARRLQSTLAMDKPSKPTRKPFRDLSTEDLLHVKGGEDAPPRPLPPRDMASGQATGKRTHKPYM